MAAQARQRFIGATLTGLLLAGCGGGGSGNSSPPVTVPPPLPANLVRVSAASTFSASCNGTPQTGTKFTNGEVEPYVVVNPASTANIVGAWQQDRWSNGG